MKTIRTYFDGVLPIVGLKIFKFITYRSVFSKGNTKTLNALSIPFNEHAQLRSGDRKAFLLVLLQLNLLALFCWYYGIQEGQGFPVLMMITVPFFVVNAFLPLRFRSLSLVGVFAVTCVWSLGWVTGGFILGVSGCIFMVAMLRIKLVYRLLMIAVITTGLIVLRNGWFFAPRAIIAVPTIASLFMFRLVSYFYHEKRGFTNVPFSLKLNYFFMLPNLVFLLFPIIDYRNIAETHYSRPAIEIYKKGLIRIGTGVMFLMIHRVLYYYCSIAPQDVRSLSDLLAFTVVSYILIIQVVGIFMICIGWVTLFGFYLPPLFENFFFATGFSDLWRRINHYWRDFVIKIFYFPLFFRIRKMGQIPAMVIAGMIAFFCSWMMHSQQLFWISGHFPLSVNDGLYWMTMGIFITADGIYQFRKSRKLKARSAIVSILISGVRVTGIFLFSSLLWTLWNADNLSSWMFIMKQGAVTDAGEILKVAGILIAAVLLAGANVHFLKPSPIKNYWYEKSLVPAAFMSAFVLLVAFKYYAGQLPSDSRYSLIADNIGMTRVNEADREMVDLGYYDQLIDIGGIGRTGTQFRLFGDVQWGEGNGATHATGDLLLRVFNPNARVKYHGIQCDINSFGIRDQEYTLVKPEGVRRWAFLGGSYILGPSLEKNETFESVLELYLNDSLKRAGESGLEILNYSMGGYMLTQQVELCNTKVFEHSPDAVFYFCHPGEENYTIKNIARLTSYGITFQKYPFLDSIVFAAGLQQSQSRIEMIRRLEPFREQIVRWGYKSIANSCRSHNAIPVWVFLPTTTDGDTKDAYAKLSGIALENGFTILNLSGVYSGHKPSQVQIGEPDTHPNAFANRLVSARMLAELRQNTVLTQSVE